MHLAPCKTAEDAVWEIYDPYTVEQGALRIFLKKTLLIWPWWVGMALIWAVRLAPYNGHWRPCYTDRGRRLNPLFWMHQLLVIRYVDMRGTIPPGRMPVALPRRKRMKR